MVTRILVSLFALSLLTPRPVLADEDPALKRARQSMVAHDLKGRGITDPRILKAMERVQIGSYTIHGEKDQKDRSNVMKMFKEGHCRLLIATDVSARGIDVPGVHYVINYDLPDRAENYVHRVGRTGRGVNKGIAISFCSPAEKERLDEIQGFINKEIEVIQISKKAYAFTIEASSPLKDLQSVLDEHEKWEKKKSRKKK